MKALEFEEMIYIEGGSCAGDVAGFTLSSIGYGLAWAAVFATTGPVGWIAGASLAVGGLSAGLSGALLVANGDCF
jgi:hypothetical protein